jgi:hypothetical protein
LRLVPDEPGAGGEQGDLVSRLRAVIGAKDEQIAALAAALEASLERERRLELRLAEVERRLSMDSSDSGTPSSKERIGAKEARRARQQSERERSRDRKRGGQPGHEGKGLKRDPDPGEKKDAAPPAECRSCRASLDGGDAVEPRWAQVIDVEFARKVTEWALPGLLPVLRDGHVRGAAARGAPGLGVLRAGAERGRGALVVLRERAAGAGRAGHRHAAWHRGLRGLGR